VTAPLWFLLACLAVFCAVSARMVRQVAAGRSCDNAAPRGRTTPAILYSFTGAMMPWKKESARLHPASYTLGIAYHGGTFLAFLWVALLAFGVGPPGAAVPASAALLTLSALCGVALLVKRMAKPELRYFSAPDDYFSNILVTGFQAMTAASLMRGGAVPVLFLYTGILLLYIPVGKLRHAIYFPLARIYLGVFYGRRGVWPAGDGRSWKA
jgi:hypothetical protein